MGFRSLTPQPPEVNKFTLTVGTSGNTTYILDRSYAAGVYTVTFQGGDNTFDIYAIGADGTNVGYTNSGTLTATGKIKEVVVLGAANNEEIIFDNVQAGDVITPTSKGDVASAGAFVTSIDISSLPNIDDSTTVTGGNFAADVEAYFIDQSANEVAAKTVVRNSSTEIVVTRPDSFSTADSPFTIKVVNPNVTLPTGSSAHLLSNAVTSGTNPVWQTTAAQAYSIGIANTITLVASDTEASDVDYAITAGSLPAGFTLDGETGVISGTSSGAADGDQTVFTVRATDAGGNFVDREFTFTANAAPTWTTTSSDIGNAGALNVDEAVSFQFVADGGTGGGSLTYSVQSGTLPTGTSLSSTGLLTGTPNTEETATFTLRATDEAGLFADKEFSLEILFPGATYPDFSSNNGNSDPIVNLQYTYTSGQLNTNSLGDIKFFNQGTTCLVAGYSNTEIMEFNLTTPWDFSSATFQGSVNAPTNVITFALSANEEYVMVGDRTGGSILKLNTPGTILNGYTNIVGFDTGTGEEQAGFFGKDGIYWGVYSRSVGNLTIYKNSSPYNFNSYSLHSSNNWDSSGDGSPLNAYAMQMSGDGSAFVLTRIGNAILYFWEMSTPWNASTITNLRKVTLPNATDMGIQLVRPDPDSTLGYLYELPNYAGAVVRQASFNWNLI